MATALDEEEYVFQLQLEEIGKISNEDKNNKHEQFQEFLPNGQLQPSIFRDTLEIEARAGQDDTENNDFKYEDDVCIPNNTSLFDILRTQTSNNGHLTEDMDPYANCCELSMCDSTSVQFNPDIVESQEIDRAGLFQNLHGKPFQHKNTNNKHVLSQEVLSNKRGQILKHPHPRRSYHDIENCDFTRCDSMLREQFNFVPSDAPDDVNTCIYEDLNLQDISNDSKYNSKNGRLLNGRVAEQIQLEVDSENAQELDKHINDPEELDRKLAEQLQLEVDIESAKELEKHNRKRSRQNGLFSEINPMNIRQKNVNLQQHWTNSFLPFGIGRNRESQHQNSQRFQQHPIQARNQQVPERDGFIRPRNQGREVPTYSLFQSTKPLMASRPTLGRAAVHQPFRNRLTNIVIPAQDSQRNEEHRPSIFQRVLLSSDIRPRSYRRPSYDLPGDDIDVDGLDYEELLDLEERMGEVKFWGMQQSDIEALPKETINDLNEIDDTQCVVCHEDFQLKEEVRKLSCSHVYHIHCIDPWLKLKSECPICKETVKKQKKRVNCRSGDTNTL